MTLQLLRRTARYVTIRLVGSYPTFSPLPLPERSGGYFLLRYSTLADSFLLADMQEYIYFAPSADVLPVPAPYLPDLQSLPSSC